MPNQTNSFLAGLFQGAGAVAQGIIEKNYKDSVAEQYKNAVTYLTDSWRDVQDRQKALLRNQNLEEGQRKSIIPYESQSSSDVLSNVYSNTRLFEPENKHYGNALEEIYKSTFGAKPKTQIISGLDGSRYLIDSDSGETLRTILEPQPKDAKVDIVWSKPKYEKRDDGTYWVSYPKESNGEVLGRYEEQIDEDTYNKIHKLGQYAPKTTGSRRYGRGSTKSPDYKESLIEKEIGKLLGEIYKDNILNQGKFSEEAKVAVRDYTGWSWDEINAKAEEYGNTPIGETDELVGEYFKERRMLSELVKDLNLEPFFASIEKDRDNPEAIEHYKSQIYNEVIAENWDNIEEELRDPLYEYVGNRIDKILGQ